MKNLALSLLIFCTLATASLALHNLELPAQKIPEHLAYTIYDQKTGEIKQVEQIKIVRLPDRLIITGNVSGKYKGQDLKQSTLTEYQIDNGRISIQSYEVMSSLEAKPFYYAITNFNWESGQAKFNFRDLKTGKAEVNTVKLTDKTILMSDASLYIMDMIGKGVSNDKVTMVFLNGKSLKAEIKIDYQPEMVELRRGKAEGYKVAVNFDLGLFSMFAPKLNFWFDSAPPHLMLKFTGPGADGKNIVQELN